MFTVRGYDDGVGYALTVADDGTLSGSERVRRMLTDHAGDTFDVTPTGPTVVLDVDDPATVLGALYALTDVTAVDGDAPEVIPPPVAGAVY